MAKVTVGAYYPKPIFGRVRVQEVKETTYDALGMAFRFYDDETMAVEVELTLKDGKTARYPITQAAYIKTEEG